MTNLRATQPHFVRCIVPNENKTPGSHPSGGWFPMGDMGGRGRGGPELGHPFPQGLCGLEFMKVCPLTASLFF